MSRPVMGASQKAIEISFGANTIVLHSVMSNISDKYELVRDAGLDEGGRVVLRLKLKDRDPGLMTAPAMTPREFVYEIPSEDVGRNHIIVM